MKRITLKLMAAFASFAIGIAGSAFWFFEKKETDNNEQFIRIVVKGQVIDHSGRPIPNARVKSRLGLDLDSAIVETDQEGRFITEASSKHWFKGPPSVNAVATGYADEYVYFDRWDKGERQFEQTIVLKPKVEVSDAQNPSR